MDKLDLYNKIVTQETKLIHQLKNVFRYNIGQKLNLFNQNVGEIEVEIVDINKKDMSFKYIRHIKNNYISNKRHVNLYMSIIKNNNFDFVVEKAVELGVNCITPIICDRTVKNNLNMERLNKIIIEATEQSGRLDLMKLNNSINFNQSLFDIFSPDNEFGFFGCIDFEVLDKESVLKHILSSKKDISIFIGPEGGFSESEIDIFKDKNILPFNFNSNVLRAETAAIVGCGIILNMLNK